MLQPRVSQVVPPHVENDQAQERARRHVPDVSCRAGIKKNRRSIENSGMRNSALRVVRNWALNHNRPDDHVRLSSVSRNLRPDPNNRVLARSVLRAKRTVFPDIMHLAKLGDAGQLKAFVKSLHPYVVKAVINAFDDEGYTPLMWASRLGHRAVVKALLEVPGIDVNAANEYGNTALKNACLGDHGDVVKLLVHARGIDVNYRGNSHYSSQALVLSATLGKSAAVRQLLLAPGIDINARNWYGSTALLGASSEGHDDIARMLMAAGIDVNVGDNSGFTPLMMASRNGQVASVAELLSFRNINIDARNRYGRTAEDIARSGGHIAVLNALKQFRSERKAANGRRV